MSSRGKFFSVISAVALLFTLVTAQSLIQNVSVSEICAIQSIFGHVEIYSDPGPKPQLFGTVRCYPKRDSYDFKEPIRFNDGATGVAFGSIQIDYPPDRLHMIKIVERYPDADSVKHVLVEKAVQKAVKYTGPMMTSKQSYAERKGEMIRYVEDQVQSGVYRTKRGTTKVVDPVTGDEKWVDSAEIVVDEEGKMVREEDGPMEEFGLKPFGLVVDVDYAPEVERQIQQQQQAIMDVQLAATEAKKAEQRALTVEQQGRATAMQAKWEQETKKAQAVTEAEQNKAVAELDAQRKLEVAKLATLEAEQYKKAKLLQADADSGYKKAILDADNALKDRLDTFVKVQGVWAEAFKQHQGNLVPQVVMGSSGGSTQTAAGTASELVTMLTAKTAKDLALDLDMRGKQ